CLFVCLLTADGTAAPEAPGRYVLGPDDVIAIRVPNIDEYATGGTNAIRIDPNGDVRLPLLGKIHAAGLTVDSLQDQVGMKLSRIMNHPDVTITVTDFASRPVSVLGSVKNPGVHQLGGRRTLLEVLSLAGGIEDTAGNAIRITRRSEMGPLPLADVKRDATGGFYIGEVDVRSLIEARDPSANIEVLPNDVITVPKGELVYVIGAVRRPGGFILNQEKQMSLLQALSLAEGLDKLAKAGSARILRPGPAGEARVEIRVDVKRILEGSARDITLNANDILFIPDSKARTASLRALDAAVQMTTGLVIWRL
ncbi:MAG TPA: polysaccharide biosynthesis/export family protein, partial [Bryobacteraceae bacterium]|nr:polysaccharide biosynthesis/export family protein [Bryobacteraceae bacterium]